MKTFDVKMTPDARSYVLSYWTEEELATELENRGGDPIRVLREVINSFFRERLKEGKYYDLVQIAKTPQGQDYYKLPNESSNKAPF